MIKFWKKRCGVCKQRRDLDLTATITAGTFTRTVDVCAQCAEDMVRAMAPVAEDIEVELDTTQTIRLRPPTTVEGA